MEGSWVRWGEQEGRSEVAEGSEWITLKEGARLSSCAAFGCRNLALPFNTVTLEYTDRPTTSCAEGESQSAQKQAPCRSTIN